MVYVYVIQSELDSGLYIGMSGNFTQKVFGAPKW